MARKTAVRTPNDLRTNGNTYLKQWQRETSKVSDPELRAVAERRREQIADSSQAMRSTLTTAAGSFGAFLRDINDIHKVIGNDLTPAGQANVRRTAVAQTAQNGGAVAEGAIHDAERAIDGLRSQIHRRGDASLDDRFVAAPLHAARFPHPGGEDAPRPAGETPAFRSAYGDFGGGCCHY